MDNSLILYFPVLLRAVLGHHPLPAWARVPQAAGEGGRGPTQDDAIQMVLKKERKQVVHKGKGVGIS